MSNQYSWLMSKDKMYINGVSSDTVGILVDTPPMPPMAEEIVETVHVIGRADSSVYRTGMYNDITLTVKCYVFDYGRHPDAIYRYLKGAQTVGFGDDILYRVKNVTGITPSYSGNGKNLLTVNFVCSPFKYAANTAPVVYELGDGEESRTIQVFNAGTVYAEPIYKLEKTISPTVGVLTVNGVTVNVAATVDTNVYIDLSLMECYKIVSGNKVRVSAVFGQWWDCILQPGYNEITFSGSESLEIVKNERFL